MLWVNFFLLCSSVFTNETRTTYDTQYSTYVGSTNIYFMEHNILLKLENLVLTLYVIEFSMT